MRSNISTSKVTYMLISKHKIFFEFINHKTVRKTNPIDQKRRLRNVLIAQRVMTQASILMIVTFSLIMVLLSCLASKVGTSLTNKINVGLTMEHANFDHVMLM